jgi:hypothetical protein
MVPGRARIALHTSAFACACSVLASRSRPLARSAVRLNGTELAQRVRQQARTLRLPAQQRSAGAQATGRQSWRCTGSR